jgi:hypothetical protein
LLTFIAIPSVRHAQIIALTGLDGVIIDCEHGESHLHLTTELGVDWQDTLVTTRCITPSPLFHP